MTTQFRTPRPAAQPVSERDNIVLKSVIHELALALGTALIPTAHAAGIDKCALCMASELEACHLECAEA